MCFFLSFIQTSVFMKGLLLFFILLNIMSINAEVQSGLNRYEDLHLLSTKELLALYEEFSPIINTGSGNLEYSKKIIEELLRQSFETQDSLLIGKSYFILARLDNNNIIIDNYVSANINQKPYPYMIHKNMKFLQNKTFHI